MALRLRLRRIAHLLRGELPVEVPGRADHGGRARGCARRVVQPASPGTVA
jgi:hypothetical protein